jgi:hypothetical protein
MDPIQLRQYEVIQEQIQRSLWQIQVENNRIKELLAEAETQLEEISQSLLTAVQVGAYGSPSVSYWARSGWPLRSLRALPENALLAKRQSIQGQ